MANLVKLEDRILQVIDTQKVYSARTIAKILRVDEDRVIEILNDDNFYNKVCSYSLANMRLAYHSIALPKLINDLESDTAFYASYDRLTKAIGYMKDGDNSAKHTLEVILKEKSALAPEEKVISPINKESKVSGNIFEVPSENKTVIPHLDEFEWEDE
jgi:anaerobic ribonucleoside-triphosphate reductase